MALMRSKIFSTDMQYIFIVTCFVFCAFILNLSPRSLVNKMHFICWSLFFQCKRGFCAGCGDQVPDAGAGEHGDRLDLLRGLVSLVLPANMGQLQEEEVGAQCIMEPLNSNCVQCDWTQLWFPGPEHRGLHPVWLLQHSTLLDWQCAGLWQFQSIFSAF